MSYDDEAQRGGRRPITYVTLHLDTCANTFGVEPCTATLAGPGKQCFNTFSTCQDPANFIRSQKLVVLTENDAGQVLKLFGLTYPALIKVDTSPTRLELGKGLGRRSSVSIEVQDFETRDALDPYAALRIKPAGGTFFGRLLARNREALLGRRLVVSQGYTDSDISVGSNLQRRTYFISQVDGPDAKGRLRIVAKDALKQADDETSVAPRPTTGVLSANIGTFDASFEIAPPIAADQYDAAGFIRIDDEVMQFTRTGTTMAVTRAQFGTPLGEHEAGATVQQCLRYDGAYVHDIVRDLLVNYAGLSIDFIDYADWSAEGTTYLSRPYGALITEPTGVRKLLDELFEVAPAYIWWDERAGKVRFRAFRPPEVGTVTLDDAFNFIKNSVKVVEKPELRISQVWIYYGVRNATGELNKASNFSKLNVTVNTDGESVNSYGVPAIKKIYTRWIPLLQDASAVDAANMLTGRYAKSPREIQFKLDAKDGALNTGDLFYSKSRQVLDPFGEVASLPMQILECEDDKPGTSLSYRALEYFYKTLPDEDGFDVITVGSDTYDFNLRSAYEQTYPGKPVTAATKVRCVVLPGVVVGSYLSGASATQAFDTGLWPAGAILQLQNQGRIQGVGGVGGAGGKLYVYNAQPSSYIPGTPGQKGGTALRVRAPLTLDNLGGKIYSGGGGGAGADTTGGGAGGGGAGRIGGPGGSGGSYYYEPPSPIGEYQGPDGSPGTLDAGGAYTVGFDGPPYGAGEVTGGSRGGVGGIPGQPGEQSYVGADFAGTPTPNLPGGEAGDSIVGYANVTILNVGDIRGPLVN